MPVEQADVLFLQALAKDSTMSEKKEAEMVGDEEEAEDGGPGSGQKGHTTAKEEDGPIKPRYPRPEISKMARERHDLVTKLEKGGNEKHPKFKEISARLKQIEKEIDHAKATGKYYDD